MIRINIDIRNPFRMVHFKNIWSRFWKVTEHRTLEVQIYRYGYNIVEINLETSFTGSDHAGPKFELGVFTWYFVISLPDNRHWDPITNSWQIYND